MIDGLAVPRSRPATGGGQHGAPAALRAAGRERERGGMAEPFVEVASIDYPILDADAHVNEPPDTWQTRVPARLRDRAPKVVHTEQGDVWSFDDGKSMRPVGLTATAGLSFLAVPAGRHHLRGHAAGFLRHEGPPRATSTPTGSTPRCSTRA